MYHNGALNSAEFNAFLQMQATDSRKSRVTFFGKEWTVDDLLAWYDHAESAEMIQNAYHLAQTEQQGATARQDALVTAMAALLGMPAPQLAANPPLDPQGRVDTPEQWSARTAEQYRVGREIDRVMAAMREKYGEDHPLMQLYFQENRLRLERAKLLPRLHLTAARAEKRTRETVDVIPPLAAREDADRQKEHGRLDMKNWKIFKFKR